MSDYSESIQFVAEGDANSSFRYRNGDGTSPREVTPREGEMSPRDDLDDSSSVQFTPEHPHIAGHLQDRSASMRLGGSLSQHGHGLRRVSSKAASVVESDASSIMFTMVSPGGGGGSFGATGMGHRRSASPSAAASVTSFPPQGAAPAPVLAPPVITTTAPTPKTSGTGTAFGAFSDLEATALNQTAASALSQTAGGKKTVASNKLRSPQGASMVKALAKATSKQQREEQRRTAAQSSGRDERDEQNGPPVVLNAAAERKLAVRPRRVFVGSEDGGDGPNSAAVAADVGGAGTANNGASPSAHIGFLEFLREEQAAQENRLGSGRPAAVVVGGPRSRGGGGGPASAVVPGEGGKAQQEVLRRAGEERTQQDADRAALRKSPLLQTDDMLPVQAQAGPDTGGGLAPILDLIVTAPAGRIAKERLIRDHLDDQVTNNEHYTAGRGDDASPVRAELTGDSATDQDSDTSSHRGLHQTSSTMAPPRGAGLQGGVPRVGRAEQVPEPWRGSRDVAPPLATARRHSAAPTAAGVAPQPAAKTPAAAAAAKGDRMVPARPVTRSKDTAADAERRVALDIQAHNAQRARSLQALADRVAAARRELLHEAQDHGAATNPTRRGVYDPQQRSAGGPVPMPSALPAPYHHVERFRPGPDEAPYAALESSGEPSPQDAGSLALPLSLSPVRRSSPLSPRRQSLLYRTVVPHTYESQFRRVLAAPPLDAVNGAATMAPRSASAATHRRPVPAHVIAEAARLRSGAPAWDFHYGPPHRSDVPSALAAADRMGRPMTLRPVTGDHSYNTSRHGTKPQRGVSADGPRRAVDFAAAPQPVQYAANDDQNHRRRKHHDDAPRHAHIISPDRDRPAAADHRHNSGRSHAEERAHILGQGPHHTAGHDGRGGDARRAAPHHSRVDDPLAVAAAAISDRYFGIAQGREDDGRRPDRRPPLFFSGGTRLTPAQCEALCDQDATIEQMLLQETAAGVPLDEAIAAVESALHGRVGRSAGASGRARLRTAASAARDNEDRYRQDGGWRGPSVVSASAANAGRSKPREGSVAVAKHVPATRTQILRNAFALVLRCLSPSRQEPRPAASDGPVVWRRELRNIATFLLAEAETYTDEVREGTASHAALSARPSRSRSRSSPQPRNPTMLLREGPADGAFQRGGTSAAAHRPPAPPYAVFGCRHPGQYRLLCDFTGGVLLPILLAPEQQAFGYFDFPTFARVVLDSPAFCSAGAATTTRMKKPSLHRGHQHSATAPAAVVDSRAGNATVPEYLAALA